MSTSEPNVRRDTTPSVDAADTHDAHDADGADTGASAAGTSAQPRDDAPEPRVVETDDASTDDIEAPRPSRSGSIQTRIARIAGVAAVAVVALLVGRWSAPGGEAPSTAAPPPAASEGSAEAAAAEAPSEYVCPMHPQVRQNEFGTCPICFMDLVPVSTGGGSASDIAVTLSDAAIALAQVRTDIVRRVPLHRDLHAFGRITAPDDGDARITAWTAGRIDRLYVDTPGETVERGQPLARLYSPELVVAQETLIHARNILAGAEASGSEPRARAARAAVDAARVELRLLGLSDRQIDRLVDDGEADTYVTIYAPAGGTVMRRIAREGDHVERGAPIVELADLDQVWAQLEIYERDLALVAPGVAVQLSVAGVDDPIDGEVTFVDPVVDPVRRVARARVVLDNPDGRLRPDLLVEATARLPVTDARGRAPVSVPDTAVLWTGRRSLVYVHDPIESPPLFMPIEVELGPHVGDRYVIRSGVFPGEHVVVNGAFRIDASLQIQGGPSMMHDTMVPGGGGDHAH